MKGIFSLLLIHCVLYCVRGQIGVLQSSNKGSCNYQFTVPNTNGACSTSSTALNHKVATVKSDLDRTRMQYVAQNSILQSTLTKIQQDASNYMTRVADLQLELQKIKTLLAASQGSGAGTNTGSGSNQNLNQVVHDAKDLLTKSLADINGKIYNLTFQFQRNSVEESKVNRAIESQINQQAVSMATMQQQVSGLENQLKSLKNKPVVVQPSAGSGNTGSSVSSVQLNALTQQYMTLQNDIQKMETDSQNKYNKLSATTTQLNQELQNQSSQISNAKTAVNGVTSRLTAAENAANQAKADLGNFKNKINPQVQIISQEIAETGKNISRVEGDLSQLGGIIMMLRGDIFANKGLVAQLQSLTNSLSGKLATLSNEVSFIITVIFSKKMYVCRKFNFKRHQFLY